MKTKRFLLALAFLAGATAQAQTTLFQDNFESGGGNWSLNGGTGDNIWIVNNVYTGFAPFLPDTPTQPGGITNAPTSNYLHVTNSSICGAGICNSNYDTGSPSNQLATLTSAINAAGYANVTLSFYYLCAGVAGQDFGTLEYSTNGGTNWTSTGTNYQNVMAWTQTSVSLPAWDNVAALKFRFRFQNSATTGLDPAFSIDQIVVTGTAQSSNTITTGATAALDYCQGENVDVPFTISGTFLAGNVFTAQLSDATGSFSAPTSIGTLSGTTAGTISCSIPVGTPPGTGYRIRVQSSNPAVTGTDNGSDITVNQLAVAGTTTVSMDSICPGTAVIVSVNGHVGSIDWMESPDGSSWGPSSLTNATETVFPAQTVYYMANVGTTCGTVQSNIVSIFVVPAPDAAFSVSTNQLTATFTDLSTGAPLAYAWSFGDGNISSLQNPVHSYATLGNYTVLLTVTNQYGCTDTTSQVVVVQTTALEPGKSGHFKVWPTVTSSAINLLLEDAQADIELTDLGGKRLLRSEMLAPGSLHNFSLAGLPGGTYFLKVVGEGWFQTVRVIKQ